ncbi:MAG: GspMb/PilO family protein [Pseudomonadota bacterium]
MTGQLVFSETRTIQRMRQGLLVASGVILALIVMLAWMKVAGQRSEMAELRGYVAMAETRMEGAIAPEAAQFYSGATLQLAQTEVQTDLQEIAGGHGSRIETVRTDQIEEKGGNIRLGLIVNGVVPEAAVGAFLAEIAGHQPALIVEDLALRRARSSGIGQRDQRMISFQMTLSGYATR